MIGIASSKQRVVVGLQKENDRLRAELLYEQGVAKAAMENADAERKVVDNLRDRLHSMELRAAEDERELQARRVLRATLDRAQGAHRGCEARVVELYGIRQKQAERIRSLTDPARTASFVAGGATFGFVLAQLWPSLWGWL